MAPAPSRQVNGETSHASDQARRLVLCFDGTSQGFHGDTSDSNVVKIHKMLERECDSQFHYYQRWSSLAVRESRAITERN